jgi:hypothetical protein
VGRLPVSVSNLPDMRISLRKAVLLVSSTIFMSLFFVPCSHGQDAYPWPPVPAEELALKENATEPGSMALMLEFRIYTDCEKSTETVYKRIKVLREEGRKVGNVEIPFFASTSLVEDIHARVTLPSGKIEEFNGTIYTKELVRAKKFLLDAMAFALPNVDVGSVIEYSYSFHYLAKVPNLFKNPGQYLILEAYAYPAAEWEIQQEIPVRHGMFTVHLLKSIHRFAYFSQKLPKGTAPRTLPDGSLQLEVGYVPALREEVNSPPESTRRAYFYVYHVLGFDGDATAFWESTAMRMAESFDKFIGNPRDFKSELNRLIQGGDSAETKIQKLYARVQQIRNLDYESPKSKKENKQEHLQENKYARDVLARGYGSGDQINLLFVALVRAAGLVAVPVRLTSRKKAFFVADRLDPSQLDAMVVEVRTAAESHFYDPATRFCPPGVLPWEETDTGGIRVETRSRGTVKTPLLASKDAVIRRSGDLTLDSAGGLSGKVTLAFEGQEALVRRLWAMNEDEASRKTRLEKELQKNLPQEGSATLVSSEGWEDSSVPLRLQFEIQVPNFAARAGERLLIPTGLLHVNSENPFSQSKRDDPIYFEYPLETYEDLVLHVPPGSQVSLTPVSVFRSGDLTMYELSAHKEGEAIRITRTFRMVAHYFSVERYPAIRMLYQKVQEGDDQQIAVRLSK